MIKKTDKSKNQKKAKSKKNVKEETKKTKKVLKKSVKRVIIIILFINIIICSCYLFVYLNKIKKEKNTYNFKIDDININQKKVDADNDKTERMLQIEELRKTNDEIIGWLEIENTNINYPVLQSKDNDYYLTHNYKKEEAISGSLFLDKNFDIKNGGSNYLIYGHRNKYGLMFEDLIKYSKEEFYQTHKIIRFTTIKDDSLYIVLSVFYSEIYLQSDTNAFKYYYFVNAETEEEYNNYIKNSKAKSLYDTKVDAKYGDQLLTLSTCEYSKKDGRFVVVLKKIKELKNNEKISTNSEVVNKK